MIARARQLSEHLKAGAADIVHINLLRDRSRWDVEAAHRAGSAVVGHLRQLAHQSMPSRRTLDLCARIVAVSEVVAAQARATGCATPVSMVYDGVDAGRFLHAGDQRSARAAIGASAEGALIGFPAAFEPRKGQDIALEAFARIAAEHPAATLVFAGPRTNLAQGADYCAGLERRAAAPDLAGRVRFLGPCANMAAFYAASDVILALSRDGEAFGRIPAEAALAGRPVIGVDAGATAELIVDAETGLLAAPGDVASAESALRRLLADPDFARRLGAGAQARARRLFASDTALDAFAALYAGIRPAR